MQISTDSLTGEFDMDDLGLEPEDYPEVYGMMPDYMLTWDGSCSRFVDEGYPEDDLDYLEPDEYDAYSEDDD